MSPTSIIIVGAGVFGVSSAIAYKKRHPTSTVTLISHSARPQPTSHDTAKIVRRVYNVEAYASLASSAMSIWSDESYKPVYHNSGWYVFQASAPAALTEGSRVVSEQEVRTVHGGIMAGAQIGDVSFVTADAATAWAEASKALDAEVRRAGGLGVKVLEGEVVDLVWDGSGKACEGVRLKSGQEVQGSVVLAMGCWTPGFLSGQGLNGELGDAEWVGVSVLGVKISEELYAKLRGMPVLAVRGEGEIMPPDSNRIIKINNSRSFSVTDPSILTKEPDEGSPFFDENMDLLLRLLPELKGSEIAFRRYCCDCLTKTQDFVISPIEEKNQLYVAYGGSFHGWKFLPNIGGYVVDMIEGKLEESWKERWSGKFESEDRIHQSVIPKRVLKKF